MPRTSGQHVIPFIEIKWQGGRRVDLRLLFLLADPIFQFSACLPHVWRLSLVKIISPLGSIVDILGSSAAPAEVWQGHTRELKISDVCDFVFCNRGWN